MPRDELTAFGAAYDVLVRLDKPARERALTWLSRVLETGAAPAADPTPEVEGPAVAVRRAKAASGATRTRKKAATAAKTKAAAKSGGGRAKDASKPGRSGSSERPYRRMPEPQEVVDAFQSVGSMSGLAEYYGVPRHTINDWARRMRGMGYQIGRSAKAE